MSDIVVCKVKLKPNKHMTNYLNDTCSYRRYCWNLGLATWNEQYQLHKKEPSKYAYPSYFHISELLTQRKKAWQYQYSSHTMCLAIRDVAHAFKYFHNKKQDNRFPKFKRKHDGKDSFKTIFTIMLTLKFRKPIILLFIMKVFKSMCNISNC